jgi:hypothetical protein
MRRRGHEAAFSANLKTVQIKQRIGLRLGLVLEGFDRSPRSSGLGLEAQRKAVEDYLNVMNRAGIKERRGYRDDE